jgi:endonuclease/exonuclease/phosphatase family metal-dependent hydrolase
MDKILDIISFNVLNRQFSPIQMLFKKFNLEKNEIKQLVRTEIKRFNQVIGPYLIKYFKSISPHTIIFLQEVNSDFLSEIKNNFADKQVFSTTEPDYIIQKGKANQKHKNIYDDKRVIIIPEFLSKYKITIDNIQFESEYAAKPVLKVSINFPDYNLVLFNLHLHWKLTNSELTRVGEKIFGHIKKTYADLNKVKIIISGDFNKGEKKVENYFSGPINKNYQIKFTNPHKTSNGDFTSHTTDIEEQKLFDVIDHILISNIEPIAHTEIVSTIKLIKSIGIMINSQELLDQLVHGQFSEGNISDHLIIKLKVII